MAQPQDVTEAFAAREYMESRERMPGDRVTLAGGVPPLHPVVADKRGRLWANKIGTTEYVMLYDPGMVEI